LALETITLASGEVTAQIVPGRGGIVTALAVGGQDVLFLDPATLADPTKNVRGGIPILFPFAGKLEDERFRPAGTRMKQHGFARNKPWAVREQRADGVRLGLVQDDETRAQYPYEYDVEYGVHLLPRGLQVELVVHNRGSQPLPISPVSIFSARCPGTAPDRRKSGISGSSRGHLSGPC